MSIIWVMTYFQNSQISPNSSKFCSFLAKSERFKRLRTEDGGRRTNGGRTHTLFKFEALLHKKPLRGNNRGLWIILIDYEHNSSHNVFLTYLQNYQISQILLFFGKIWEIQKASEDGRGWGWGWGGRTYTLFKFEAHLHKKPLRGKDTKIFFQELLRIWK